MNIKKGLKRIHKVIIILTIIISFIYLYKDYQEYKLRINKRISRIKYRSFPMLKQAQSLEKKINPQALTYMCLYHNNDITLESCYVTNNATGDIAINYSALYEIASPELYFNINITEPILIKASLKAFRNFALEYMKNNPNTTRDEINNGWKTFEEYNEAYLREDWESVFKDNIEEWNSEVAFVNSFNIYIKNKDWSLHELNVIKKFRYDFESFFINWILIIIPSVIFVPYILIFIYKFILLPPFNYFKDGFKDD